MINRRQIFIGLSVLTIAAPFAHAQTFPTKPLRIIVPYAAGGISDIATRLVGMKMSESLGQTVTVDNRPGASAIIGSEIVARATPDGYTLLATSITHTVIGSLIPNLPFDPVADFAPIGVVASATSALTVNARSPFKTVAELVAFAKKNPDGLSFASGGNGALAHLSGERFKREAGIQMIHIPYKGGGPASSDLLAGHVSVFFDVLTSCLPNIKAGSVRALAVTSAQRSPFLPDVPTLIESGFPGFTASAWTVLLAPAQTPRAVIERLSAALLKAEQSPEVVAALGKLATDQGGGSPAQLAAFLADETSRWSKVVKEAGIKNE